MLTKHPCGELHAQKQSITLRITRSPAGTRNAWKTLVMSDENDETRHHEPDPESNARSRHPWREDKRRLQPSMLRSKDRSCPCVVHPWGVGGRGDQCVRKHRLPADDGCQQPPGIGVFAPMLGVCAPPVVHLCQDTNLSQADNNDQRSWLAVDQVVQTENPLANLSTPYQVNDHAGIE